MRPLLSGLKSSIKRGVRALGYQVARYPPADSYEAQLARFLKGLNINLVLDVGAHEGEYYRKLREVGYRGRIASFEPVPESFKRLESVASGDENWRGYQLALGNRPCRRDIKVPRSTGFASFLEPNAFYDERFPYAHWNGERVEVSVERLDAIFDAVAAGIAHPSAFLKIDTQGWDALVIDGATDCLRCVVALQSELPVIPIYREMRGLEESLLEYRQLGYQLVNLFPVSYDLDNVSVIEFDCLMRRRESGAASRRDSAATLEIQIEDSPAEPA